MLGMGCTFFLNLGHSVIKVYCVGTLIQNSNNDSHIEPRSRPEVSCLRFFGVGPGYETETELC